MSHKPYNLISLSRRKKLRAQAHRYYNNEPPDHSKRNIIKSVLLALLLILALAMLMTI